jgi:hypothetical protein
MKNKVFAGLFMLAVLAFSVSSCSIKEKCPAYGSIEAQGVSEVADLG